jgi:hypothetical protein
MHHPDPLAVVARGLAVFPLPRGGRVPAVKDWPTIATSDPDIIRRHWRSGSNIGVGCQASRLLGVDLDRNHGDGSADGVETFTNLCAERGEAWPHTFTVRTPRGGLHLYYRAPSTRPFGNTSGRLGPGIDTRGPGDGNHGGYLVGPGSVVDGRAYEVVRDMPIQPLPAWLADLLDPRPQAPRPVQPVTLPRVSDRYASRALEGEVQRVLGARAGERNDQLNRAAFALGTLVGAAMLDRDTAEAALLQAAESVGLVDDDGARQVTATIRSGLRAGIAKPRVKVQGVR